MKKVLFVLFLMLTSFALEAQVNFMGIPVEGSVYAFKSQLRKKGFKTMPSIEGNFFTGSFYKRNVLVSVNKNRDDIVESVTVLFMKSIIANNMEGYDRETTIQLFNDLLYSFDNNEKYVNGSSVFNNTEYECYFDKIEKDTDLWFNIKVKKIDYHSYYQQLPFENDNMVDFHIEIDNHHYDQYFIILYYRNHKIMTTGSEDL